MADLKIITHTTYTYETTDGREFDSKPEAEAWQNAIDNTDRIVMLDSRFKLTNDFEKAFFIHIDNPDQLEAFNTKQADLGIASIIKGLGYYYYDEVSDEYIDIDAEIGRLLDLKARLDSTRK